MSSFETGVGKRGPIDSLGVGEEFQEVDDSQGVEWGSVYE